MRVSISQYIDSPLFPWQEGWTTLLHQQDLLHFKENLFLLNTIWHKDGLVPKPWKHIQIFPSSKTTYKNNKNREPWRLTSHPRPQRDHPRAWGNKVQLVTYNTTQYMLNTTIIHTIHWITKQLPKPRLNTKIHPLNQIEGWRWAFTMRRIQTMNHIDAQSFIIIKPFWGLLSMPFRGIQCLSSPHTSLCLP